MYEKLDSLIVSIIKASREANLARISSGDVWIGVVGEKVRQYFDMTFLGSDV